MADPSTEKEIEQIQQLIGGNPNFPWVDVSVGTLREMFRQMDAYREIVDGLAHEDRHRKPGEDSSDYLIRLIERARALLAGPGQG